MSIVGVIVCGWVPYMVLTLLWLYRTVHGQLLTVVHSFAYFIMFITTWTDYIIFFQKMRNADILKRMISDCKRSRQERQNEGTGAFELQRILKVFL